ncbi:MAG: DUF2970 domain-containing protein [Gammaproteobacteria bacterium]
MTDDNQNSENNSDKKPARVTLLTIIGSLYAGLFGVQSNKNRERDFTHGKLSTFIYAGIIFVVLFVIGVIGIVQLVMKFAAH